MILGQPQRVHRQLNCKDDFAHSTFRKPELGLSQPRAAVPMGYVRRHSLAHSRTRHATPIPRHVFVCRTDRTDPIPCVPRWRSQPVHQPRVLEACLLVTVESIEQVWAACKGLCSFSAYFSRFQCIQCRSLVRTALRRRQEWTDLTAHGAPTDSVTRV